MQEFDETCDGATAHLAAGERFRIRLPENRTSGFRWTVAENPLARVAAASYAPGGMQPGAGGIHTWEFECTAAGSAPLELALSRPWEPEAPARRFSLMLEAGAA